MIKKFAIVFVAIFLLLNLPELSFSESSTSHKVTVCAQSINEVALNGGNVTLTINSAIAGDDTTCIEENTICDLLWTTNESNKKITVASDNGSQNFTLKVSAENVRGGSASPEVPLSTTTTDLITGITSTTGKCDIRYSALYNAFADRPDGTGADNHTITYTLTDS